MFLTPSLPRLAPSPNLEFESIEWFVACDPMEMEEEQVEPEFLAIVSGAVLGSLGLEHLHHALEGLEHIGELQDSLRPVIQRQQLTDAIAAFKRSPRAFAPGEVKGVWLRIQVPRQQLYQAVLATAPSHRVPSPTLNPVLVIDRRSPPPRHRLRQKLVPAWARC
ncbi:MAG: hypothetical protein RSP_04910 [Rhodanobacter sp.]